MSLASKLAGTFRRRCIMLPGSVRLRDRLRPQLSGLGGAGLAGHQLTQPPMYPSKISASQELPSAEHRFLLVNVMPVTSLTFLPKHGGRSLPGLIYQ
eukprot:8748257-Pyramimonas_sp.AAC.1